MADDKPGLHEDELASASGGATKDDDKSCITYTCSECGGNVTYAWYLSAINPFSDVYMCENCMTAFNDEGVKKLPYFITKKF